MNTSSPSHSPSTGRINHRGRLRGCFPLKPHKMSPDLQCQAYLVASRPRGKNWSEANRLILSLQYSRNRHLCDSQKEQEQPKTDFVKHPNVYLPILKQFAHIALGYIQGHGIIIMGRRCPFILDSSTTSPAGCPLHGNFSF